MQPVCPRPLELFHLLSVVWLPETRRLFHAQDSMSGRVQVIAQRFISLDLLICFLNVLVQDQSSTANLLLV